ncbi:MAG: antitoxin family protein [Chloroflexi bacterium]|nr:antitoxin family protein [Chloroflexota bacterium]
MALVVRAVVEDGQLKLLDPVDLPEGQQLRLQIETLSEEDAIRAALGDAVRWHDTSDDSDAWVEDMAGEIAQALSKGPSLSQIIIEERESGW